VAILGGLEDDRAVLWRVFSNVVKPEKTVWLDGTKNDPKALYNFHESIVNALRPTLKEGVRSIILASPARSDFARSFMDHIHRHHLWLVQGQNKATFSEITGFAGTLAEVAALTRTPTFRRLISETTAEETEDLVDMLEKRLNSSNQDKVALYSLIEIEDLILWPQKPKRLAAEYLMLTDLYLSNSHEKKRIHRLMQIAINRNVKTRIVDAGSTAGLRLNQLGGIVCLAQAQKTQ